MTEQALPRNWETWALADAGEWLGGGTPSKANKQYWSGSISWVSPKDMKALTISDAEDRITEEAVTKSAVKIIPDHSVLFVTRSGILAHSFPVAVTKAQVTINQDLKAITPEPVLDPDYLSWCLRAHEREILKSCTKHGTTVHSIEIPSLKAFRVPIAPHREQLRIVAKIDELFSELDKGVESLKTAREQLNVYRQAVLEHAFEGKLTARWREENKDKLETPDQILVRIKKEREARYQQQLADWEGAAKEREAKGRKGKKPGKPRTPKSVTSLPADVLATLPAVPDYWAWHKLGWMTCGVEYGTAAKSADVGVIPVIRMGNLQNGMIDWGDLVFTSDNAEIAKYALTAGDVLFNRTNSPELVGKTAIYRGEHPALFAGYLIRVNQIPDVADSQYLNLFLNSHLARRHGSSVKTDGVNQSNINGKKLQSYPFPYCSLAEQKEVVRALDEKLSLTDRLFNDVDTQLAKADALRQSILRKAFSGQLVVQDPNDEPASLHLERIKADKTAPAKRRKDNKKNTKDKRKDAA